MIMRWSLFEAAVIAGAISILPGSFAQDCNTKKREPIGPFFKNIVPNALEPDFKYVPDSPGNPNTYSVGVGEALHEPGFTCDDGVTNVITKIYGYGQDNVYTWPGKTFEVKSFVPINVKWENNIQQGEHILTGADNTGLDNIEVNYLDMPPFNITPTNNSHKTVVDTSLHWAYSLDDIKGTGLPGPCQDGTCFDVVGVPIVTHLHGGHSDAIFDGNPEFFYNYEGDVLGPQYETNEYTYKNNFEPASIWYHDHALGITRLNVYAGMAGFYFLRDNRDTGTPDNKLGLPAFPYELAYAIQDRMFKNNGELLYPAFPGDPGFEGFIVEEEADLSGHPFENWGPTALAEFFGDHMVVNGKVWPKTDVEPRSYRLRLLNGCDSRFLVLEFVKAETEEKLGFYVIGTDQGFKTKKTGPVSEQTQVIMSPGERIDVVIDFGQNQANDYRVILKNSGGDEPFKGLDNPVETSNETARVMAFDVNGTRVVDFNIDDFNSKLDVDGHSPVKETVSRIRKVALFEGRDEYNRLQPLLGTAEPATDSRGNPINWPDEYPYDEEELVGQVVGTVAWHTEPATENPKFNQVEEWYIINVSADAHPIHLHLVDFEVVARFALFFDSGLPDGQKTDPVEEIEDFDPDVNITGDGIYLSEQAAIQHNGARGSGRKIVYSCDTDAEPNCWFNSTPAAHPEYNDIGYPKDLVTALPGEVTVIKAQFRKEGRYVWHCHILSHEDHEMMRVMQVGRVPNRNLRGENENDIEGDA